MNHDRPTNSQRAADAGDVVVGPVGGVRHNKTLTPDPIGADVGPLPPIDGVPGSPADENGAIDGLPGRYERQAQEDAAGLDLTRVPLGANNE
ncbi:MAG TPA: hypothetical protein VF337_00515 [Candidatus Limnocylindrales bacterium]